MDYCEKWKILGKITVKGVNNTREAMRVVRSTKCGNVGCSIST